MVGTGRAEEPVDVLIEWSVDVPESGTFRGRRAAKIGSIPRGVSNWGRPQPHVRGSRGERFNRGVLCSGEVGVPAVEVVGELVVEDAGADLNEQMGTAWGPAHLLLLYHALADHLVHCGLGERGGDGLAGAAAFAVVGDAPGVGPQVGVELARRGEQLARLVAGLQRLQVDDDALDGLQGAEDVAVPEKPLQ